MDVESFENFLKYVQMRKTGSKYARSYLANRQAKCGWTLDAYKWALPNTTTIILYKTKLKWLLINLLKTNSLIIRDGIVRHAEYSRPGNVNKWSQVVNRKRKF